MADAGGTGGTGATDRTEKPPLTTEELSAQVVVVGGGPAGLISALLFARAGVSTLVLESHADFLRDFRGDTVHPSTLALFHQLGWLDEFLALPHDRADSISATFSDLAPSAPTLKLADFTRLRGNKNVPCPFVAMMPQDAFLNFVDAKARAYGEGRTYRLVRNAKVTGLIYDDVDPSHPKTCRRVVGVRARLATTTTEGNKEGVELIARASSLVVAADGRRSAVRAAANLPPAIYPGNAPPFDVLWFRVPRDQKHDPSPGRTQGFVSRGCFIVSIFRGTYYQMGFLVAKGGAERVRAEGLPPFARRVAKAVSYLSPERVEAALPRFFGGGGSKEEHGGKGAAEQGRDVHVLDVRVDRLSRWWRPGMVCIGDAAHAMSPVGGVGINLAVQDGVALANLLAAKIARGGGGGGGGGESTAYRASDADLAALQKRREAPTRLTQLLQVLIQRRVIAGVLEEGPPLMPPLPLRLMQRFPALAWLPARLIGVGFRPERICSPEKVAAAADRKRRPYHEDDDHDHDNQTKPAFLL